MLCISLFASANAASSLTTRRQCGSAGPIHDMIEAQKTRAQFSNSSNYGSPRVAQAQALKQSPLDVSVHFWAVQGPTWAGTIPTGVLRLMVKKLNTAFKAKAVFTKRTASAVFFKNNREAWVLLTPQRITIQRSLRIGGPLDLNVFITAMGTTSDAQILGLATFPSDYQYDPRIDGVTIDYRSLPGPNAFADYNQGNTLIHEVGHWLGLFHTFQDGCRPPGDYVSDTPSQATPDYQCAVAVATCGPRVFHDVHNYMNYVDDKCMTHFTPGQYSRIANQAHFRIPDFPPFRVWSEYAIFPDYLPNTVIRGSGSSVVIARTPARWRDSDGSDKFIFEPVPGRARQNIFTIRTVRSPPRCIGVQRPQAGAPAPVPVTSDPCNGNGDTSQQWQAVLSTGQKMIFLPAAANTGTRKQCLSVRNSASAARTPLVTQACQTASNRNQLFVAVCVKGCGTGF